MPKKNQEFLDEMIYHLDDDSSDEDDSDDESDANSDDESGSGSDDDSGSDSESESDSDDSDETGSGSDSDDSENEKKKISNKEQEEKQEEEVSAIYKIKQISSKLSWLLDDLHKTFKPKSVPKIDPKAVFPYPYYPVPQSPSKLKDNYQYNHQYINDIQHLNDNKAENDPKIHFATHNKSPISSPIRHGNEVDRGVGGHFIFPSYAAPPSKSEINKLYGNYSEKEKAKIAENQRKENERKSINSFTRKLKNRNAWQDGNFSDRFMSASNQRRNASKRGLFHKNDEFDEASIPHTFDELYKHYDEQKRMIEQKQIKMQRMKDKLYWFRKNGASNRLSQIENHKLRIAEKKPFLNRDKSKNNQHLINAHDLKETENKLLNKAAQILLGNMNENAVSRTGKEYDVTRPDSPDSLQEKIINIASDGDGDDEDENRLPTFV